ncbi:MAG: hypothetical protein EXR43_02875 [Dehalococcoidia bacterium]|nr:hypothetical protein [Dehalococcoidia bacterium]
MGVWNRREFEQIAASTAPSSHRRDGTVVVFSGMIGQGDEKVTTTVEGDDFGSSEFRWDVWSQTATTVALVTTCAEGKQDVMAAERAMMVSAAPLRFVISVATSRVTHDLVVRSAESRCGQARRALRSDLMEPIPGRPCTLIIFDHRLNIGLAEKLVAALRRRGVLVQYNGPTGVSKSESWEMRAGDVNCLLVIRHQGNPVFRLPTSSAPRLLILADAGDEYTPSDDVAPSDAFPAVVRVALSGGYRVAMFFLVKYLYELDLHCRDSITWEMLRFSHFKALQIVRRRYPSFSSRLSILGV